MLMSSNTSSWSASRKPPAKGCLSHTKKRKMSPTTTRRIVQFGSPRAVEFDASQPSTQHFLTPLPSEVTRQRYSMTKTTLVLEEDVMLSEETKRNSALLAEWDDEEDDHAGPLRATSSAEAKRRRHKRQNHRRSSSLFTPSPNSTSLLEDDSDDDDSDKEDHPPHHHHEKDVAAVPPNEEEPSPPSQQGHATMGRLDDTTIASLCVVHVDSPLLIQQEPQQPPSLTPASSGSTSSSSSDESSSSSPSLLSSSSRLRNTEGSTTELAVPLNMVHVHGAAANMRQRKNPPNTHCPTSSTTTTGLDNNNTATTPQHWSPTIAPMSATTTTTTSTNKKNIRIVPTTILRLRQDPSQVVDPVWEFPDICWALATAQQHTTTQFSANDDKNHPQRLLQAVLNNPHWDGVVSCLDDLYEQARFCANTKSHTKFKLPSSQQTRALHMVLREWIQLELEFLSELTQVLQRNTAHARNLWRRACQFLETITPGSRNDDKNTSSSNQTNKRRAQQLERDIVKLEETIHEQEQRLKIQEAAEAPYASLYCQATSHMGICGFRFDAFHETSTLELAYEHPPIMAGVVETQCTFDMRHGEWKARYCCSWSEDAELSSSPELLPATTSHPAAQFHKHVVTTWLANHHHGSNDTGALWRRLVGDLPLQDALLTLSEWLGELDAVTQDLVELSKTHGLQFEWPRLILSIHDDDDDDANTTTLTLVYDEACMGSTTNSLLGPIRCILTQNGTVTPMMNVPLRCREKPHLVSSILQECLRKSSTREKVE